MKKKENTGAERRAQSEKGKQPVAERKVQRAKSREQSASSEHPFLPIEKAEYGFSREGVNYEQPRPTGSSGREVTRGISTVFHIKKPSATETRFPAEGCISESRAIRACLMIRVFNN